MDLLFDLPLHLTVNILGGWLGLRSIIKLDQSYCNESSRRTFIHTIQSDELVVTDPSIYSDDYPIELVKWCLLRSIRLSFFVFGYETMDALSSTTIEAFLHMNKSVLTTIGVHSSAPGTDWWDYICINCANLEEIEVECSAKLSGDGFVSLLRANCASLQKVDLNCILSAAELPVDCDFTVLGEFHARVDVRLYGIEHFLTKCAQLRRFSIAATFHNLILLQSLKEHCKCIQSINLIDVTDSSVYGIELYCPDGPAIHLKFHAEASEACMMTCISKCTNIQSLTFYDCQNCTNNVLNHIRVRCNTSLRKLSLNSCLKKSADALTALVGNCKKLSLLYLRHGPKMDPNQLYTMVKTCRKLTRLTMLGYEVTDKVLQGMSQYCRGLVHLNIEITHKSKCDYSEKGMYTLLSGCSGLTSLYVGRAAKSKLRPSVRADLMSKYPLLCITGPELSAESLADDSDEVQ